MRCSLRQIAHCESMSLASLHLQNTFVSEGVPTSHVLQFLSSQVPRRKKQQSQRPEKTASKEPMHVSPSPQGDDSLCSFPKRISTLHLERASCSPLDDLKRMLLLIPCHWQPLIQRISPASWKTRLPSAQGWCS